MISKKTAAAKSIAAMINSKLVNPTLAKMAYTSGILKINRIK
jgi:hypothetical protein